MTAAKTGLIVSKHRGKETKMAGPNPYQEEVATDDRLKPVPRSDAAGTLGPSDETRNDEDDGDTVEDPNANGDEGGVS
jgi:hypothetical protein